MTKSKAQTSFDQLEIFLISSTDTNTVIQTDNIASVLMLIIMTDFSYDGLLFQPWMDSCFNSASTIICREYYK